MKTAVVLTVNSDYLSVFCFLLIYIWLMYYILIRILLKFALKIP